MVAGGSLDPDVEYLIARLTRAVRIVSCRVIPTSSNHALKTFSFWPLRMTSRRIDRPSAVPEMTFFTIRRDVIRAAFTKGVVNHGGGS